MGLFIIAGLILVAALVIHILDLNCRGDWQFTAKLICLVVGCGMLFVLFMMMSTNRGDAVVDEMEKNYTMITCALEGTDNLSDYAVILPEAKAYNKEIENHRKYRANDLTNWLYSPVIAEMPLIDISQYDTGN